MYSKLKRLFVLGDLHLGVRNNSIEWSNIQSSFLLDFFLPKLDELGFNPDEDGLVQLGDWHHVRESTNNRILSVSHEIANAFNKKFKHIFVILGNHDVYYKDNNSIHSLKGFDTLFPNFNIYEEPCSIKLGNHNFLMLPWVENLTQLQKYVKDNSKKCDYIFCHADYTNAKLNNFVKVSHGLKNKDISTYKKVYSGHIHIRQEENNFLYVGTPYEMDRGDCGNTKGFYILDISKDNIKEQFIENTHSPKHIKIDMFDLLEMNLLEIKKLFNNNFVDIKIESKLSQKVQYSQFTEYIKDFNHRRLEFYPYNSELLEATLSNVEINDNYEFDIHKLLKEKLVALSFDSDKSTKITNYFNKIYNQINSNTK